MTQTNLGRTVMQALTAFVITGALLGPGSTALPQAGETYTNSTGIKWTVSVRIGTGSASAPLGIAQLRRNGVIRSCWCLLQWNAASNGHYRLLGNPWYGLNIFRLRQAQESPGSVGD